MSDHTVWPLPFEVCRVPGLSQAVPNQGLVDRHLLGILELFKMCHVVCWLFSLLSSSVWKRELFEVCRGRGGVGKRDGILSR